MVARIIPVDPFDIVVFGGTGDLARRKLLPSLYHCRRVGQAPEGSKLIGVARSSMDDDAYRALVREACAAHVPCGDFDPEQIEAFARDARYLALDVGEGAEWANLRAALEGGEDRPRVFYLATLPRLFGLICQRLAEHELITPRTRVVIEKPIGHDLASAQEINAAVGAVFEEHRIFRIDHYLGKETVQNLVALRFGNSMFEPLWNRQYIDHVQITVAERVGVGDRAGYYDRAGALRDMVQNHLLQLLCLVAMEPPSRFEQDAVRDEKLKILRALAPIEGAGVARSLVRGQYKAGAIDGELTRGYIEELDGAHSDTETYAALRCEIENWRWRGVPFYLRTGKRLQKRISEIVVQFKTPPYSIFEDDVHLEPNRLVLQLQPNEGAELYLMSKDPGPGGLRLREAPLDISYADAFTARYPDAYERLLMDVVRGNATLFMRKDEVEAAWRWIDPIIAELGKPELAPKGYVAGGWGPPAATAMIERDGRTWFEETKR